MFTLSGTPKNEEKFKRLKEFFKVVLDVCAEVDVVPVLDGSLAVFVYTGEPELNVNDVDLACSEADFPKLIAALETHNINYRLREYHVLQVLKDDLKVELGSAEHWSKNVPQVYETLHIDDYTVTMLALSSVREFYRQGMLDQEGRTEENERNKYLDLKSKYDLLSSVMGEKG